MSSLREETIASDEELYLATLNDREMKAYHIAVAHLGMSFTMEKSNGFLEWKKERDARIKQHQEESPK
jgi:hypothetical protein